MRVDVADRALRSLVAELAGLKDEDVEAILAELDIASRDRLRALLDAYHRGDAPVAIAEWALNGPHYSEWLLDRLSVRPGRPAAPVTSHALAVLREAARQLGWKDVPPATVERGVSPGGLMSRLGWWS